MDTLPVEIFQKIADLVPRDDLPQFRLTSRAFAAYGCAPLFSEARAWWSEDSLDKLQHIATTPGLAQHVRTLRFALDLFDDKAARHNTLFRPKARLGLLARRRLRRSLPPGQPYPYVEPKKQPAALVTRSAAARQRALRTARTTLRDAFRADCHMQKDLLESGRGRAILRNVFGLLPKLRKLDAGPSSSSSSSTSTSTSTTSTTNTTTGIIPTTSGSSTTSSPELQSVVALEQRGGGLAFVYRQPLEEVLREEAAHAQATIETWDVHNPVETLGCRP
ncbi:MAG: hypothetical protein M1837_000647 [Sclerophora amabilis]|nr:MAG: hypothetical protein M1837_000647 [Sclerophora amabilis]